MWIQTYTAKCVDLLNPQPDSIDIVDIAHALAQICRFTGHTRKHYSVAQHSVLVAEQLPTSLQLYGLLHDAHEAYIGDLSLPLKVVLKELGAGLICRQLQAGIDEAVWHAAGLAPPDKLTRDHIATADLVLLMTERRDLMVGAPPRPWAGNLENIIPLPEKITPWSAADAKAEFLAMFDRLQYARDRRADFLAR